MFGILQDSTGAYSVELKSPSNMSESSEVIGGYNTTLRGGKRRFIRAIKKTWSFSYDVLTQEEAQGLINMYNLLEVDGLQVSQPYLVLTVYDPNFNITSESVHLDIDALSYIPGTNMLSSITLNFMQI